MKPIFFTQLSHDSNLFFSTSLGSEKLTQDLINLYRTCYNYKNAQRSQKVYQYLEGIARTCLPEKIEFYKKQMKEYDFVLSRRNFDIKNNVTDYEDDANSIIDVPEFRSMVYGLAKIISLFLDNLRKVEALCLKCFQMSKAKISLHSELGIVGYV